MPKPNSVSNHVTVVVLLVTLCLSILSSTVKAQLVSDFYKTSCPNAESKITSAVNSSFNKRRASPPGVLRIHFHDCFVNVSARINLLSGPKICCEKFIFKEVFGVLKTLFIRCV
ncbi:hypothetical protein M758_UG125000 [Ceratodon purpureus]|nr:hypothetical protein M758_UG125000 [Ceratodon purpureus]